MSWKLYIFKMFLFKKLIKKRKIDKFGYVINKGVKTNEFWDGTITFSKKPLRIKIRNISGDELVIKID